MHVLESYLVAVDTGQPIFELGDSVGSVVFLLTSQVLDCDGVGELVLLKTEG